MAFSQLCSPLSACKQPFPASPPPTPAPSPAPSHPGLREALLDFHPVLSAHLPLSLLPAPSGQAESSRAESQARPLWGPHFAHLVLTEMWCCGVHLVPFGPLGLRRPSPGSQAGGPGSQPQVGEAARALRQESCLSHYDSATPPPLPTWCLGWGASPP